MVLKKRQLLMATLVIALGAAIFVNWYYTRPETASPVDGSTLAAGQTKEADRDNLGDAQYVNSNDKGKLTSEYFASAKLRRTTAHDEAKEAINKVISNASAGKEEKEQANAVLEELVKLIKLEGDIENLITAKLSTECVVVINGSNVEVVVGVGTLDDQSVLQVKEIVIKQTGYDAGNITITELNG